jgi:hypothetical protein
MSFLERSDLSKQIGTLIAPALAVTAFSQDLNRQLIDYANFAEQRSKQEEKFGNSCEGDPQVAQCGPICELRLAQSAEAKAQAAKAARISERVIDLRTKAGGITTQEGIDRLFLDVASLTTGSDLAAIRSWADNEATGFLGGFEGPGSEPLICRDSAALALVRKIRDATEATAELPAIAPQLRAQGVGEAAQLNLAAMLSVLPLVFDPPSLKARLSDEDVAPFLPAWGFALIIEAICAAVALGDGWSKRRYLGDPWGRPLDPNIRQRHALLARALVGLTFPVIVRGSHAYVLLCPVDATGPAMLLSTLPHNLPNGKWFGQRIGLRPTEMAALTDLDSLGLTESQQAAIEELTGGARAFSVWYFPNYLSVVRRIYRDLGIDDLRPPRQPNGPGLRLVA